MNHFRLKVRPVFFEALERNQKKHEYRLNDGRRDIKAGDVLVIFDNQEPSRYIKRVVDGVETIKDWDEAVHRYPEDFSFINADEESILKECGRIYSRDQIGKYGLLAIKLKRKSDDIKGKNVLLDTNIVIGRESFGDCSADVANLYKVLDALACHKFLSPLVSKELSKYGDESVRNSILQKLNSYEELPSLPISDEHFSSVVEKFGHSPNDEIDNAYLYQVYKGRADFLITEDKALLAKAEALYLSDSVFSANGFLAKAYEQQPRLIEYKALSIKQERFKDVDLDDPFFDSLKSDYGSSFSAWFRKKANDPAYIFRDSRGKLSGFLYLKEEGEGEDYMDMEPPFPRKKRLKVGTFKVKSTGLRVGERFLKIIFDNAKRLKAEEIYVTMFPDKRPETGALRKLLEKWGFVHWGKKGEEDVLVKNMNGYDPNQDPLFNFPNLKPKKKYGFLPIYPDYHTRLFPDLCLSNENMIMEEEKACGYALEKVYLSGYYPSEYSPGDLLLVYRPGREWKKYTSVVTGACILEEYKRFDDLEELKKYAANRTVFSDSEIEGMFRRGCRTAIRVIYLWALSKKVIAKRLWELGILPYAGGARLSTVITRDQVEAVLMEGGGTR